MDTTAHPPPAIPPPQAPLLQVANLRKYFMGRRRWFRSRLTPVRAVDGVTFSVASGESYALVGESGCGKTTTARMVLRLLEPTSGRIRFEDRDIWWDGIANPDSADRRLAACSACSASPGPASPGPASPDSPRQAPVRLRGSRLRPMRRWVQAVFQDPVSSLNPKMRVGAAIAEGITIHFPRRSGKNLSERVAELLELVGLPPDSAGRFPHEFSGGQRQRVGIARALAVEPRLLVCDEAVSALDISVQAQIINLFSDLRERLGLAYLFIAHDLAVVGRMAHRVGVMYAGQLMEEGPAADVLLRPMHPYTRELVAAAPSIGRAGRGAAALAETEPPEPPRAPGAALGCPYALRCQKADGACREGVIPESRMGSRRIKCRHAGRGGEA